MTGSTGSKWLQRAALILVLACTAANAQNGRQCVDPCLQAARQAQRACAADAGDASREAFDGCLERDHTCVDACRAGRQDCRDGTTLDEDLALCRIELAAGTAKCHNDFRLGSDRRAICIDRARVEGFRCSQRARHRVLGELKGCQATFEQCASVCGPGEAPGGSDTCRAEGRSALRGDLAGCRSAFRATTAGCINRDITCVQECQDAEDTCRAPTQAVLDAAVASCKTERDAALAACSAADPSSGAVFAQCAQEALAAAFTCRDGARAAAQPGFNACRRSYLGCILGCPRT